MCARTDSTVQMLCTDFVRPQQLKLNCVVYDIRRTSRKDTPVVCSFDDVDLDMQRHPICVPVRHITVFLEWHDYFAAFSNVIQQTCSSKKWTIHSSGMICVRHSHFLRFLCAKQPQTNKQEYTTTRVFCNSFTQYAFALHCIALQKRNITAT